MLKDKYSYIALFTYEDAGISIEFPDLPAAIRVLIKTIPMRP